MLKLIYKPIWGFFGGISFIIFLEKTLVIIEKRKEKKIYGTFTTFSYRSNKEDVQVLPDFK